MSIFGGRRQQQPEQTPPPEPASEPAPAPRQPIGFETVLGASARLTGDLHSEGNVRLDGNFEGDLQIEGNVLIGETAKITADINARNISIAGAVRGNVSGNKVQILRTGRVWGDITARAITTEEGAFIDGKITMVSHEAAAESMAPAALPEPEAEAAPAPEAPAVEAEYEPLPPSEPAEDPGDDAPDPWAAAPSDDPLEAPEEEENRSFGPPYGNWDDDAEDPAPPVDDEGVFG